MKYTAAGAQQAAVGFARLEERDAASRPEHARGLGEQGGHLGHVAEREAAGRAVHAAVGEREPERVRLDGALVPALRSIPCEKSKPTVR